jgi:RNA polymerase sigma-70 factor (ECF subfamily)
MLSENAIADSEKFFEKGCTPSMAYQGNSSNGTGSVAKDDPSSGFLRRVKASEQDAWRRLVELYGPLVYRWCRVAGLQPSDSADVSQEVFAAVSKSVDSFVPKETGGGFRPWLWGIARHRILDFFRQHRNTPQAAGGTDAHQQVLQLPDTYEGSAIDQPLDSADPVWTRALALTEAEFEPRTWRAFWRVVVDGQRPAEVAEELNTTIAAVYQAKARVLRALRDQLGELEEIP